MAIGAVDMLIPPSALTVLLGSLSGISISKLLIGGVLPGIMLSLAFVLWIVVRVKISPELAPQDETPPSLKGWPRYRLFVFYVLPTLSIFAVVVGALAQGWATPTECAAIGAFATLVQASLFKVLKWSSMVKALEGTASISGMILFIILGATTFAQILSFSGASTGLVQWIIGQGLSKDLVIIGMMVVLIVLGIFVDQVSMMMITLPIFMPLVQSLGIDVIWFGILFLICMQMGLLLPPHGLLIMTMRGVAPPSVTMLHLYQAVAPYVLMSLLLLMAVFLFPPIATYFPALLG
jgi:tripartite ATP-independent transporter DctM subunit